MITVEEAIKKVNQEIWKEHDPNIYRVYRYRTWTFGWDMDWMPNDTRYILYGSSNFLVHHNGFLSDYGQVAWDNKLSLHDINVIHQIFCKLAEKHGNAS